MPRPSPGSARLREARPECSLNSWVPLMPGASADWRATSRGDVGSRRSPHHDPRPALSSHPRKLTASSCRRPGSPQSRVRVGLSRSVPVAIRGKARCRPGKTSLPGTAALTTADNSSVRRFPTPIHRMASGSNRSNAVRRYASSCPGAESSASSRSAFEARRADAASRAALGRRLFRSPFRGCDNMYALRWGEPPSLGSLQCRAGRSPSQHRYRSVTQDVQPVLS